MRLMGSSPAGDRLDMDSKSQTRFASRFPGLAHPYRPAPQLGLCGLVQPACISFFHPSTYHKNTEHAICLVAGLILLSSAAGGVLWHFHDMQAGYFPSWERRLGAFADGVFAGITVGWRIVLLSFPLNVLSVAFAYAANGNSAS